ncbi:MAG TPA: hypothetical protein VLH41_07610 [Thermoanaerobaculia bacterium]|nr:hypothetical protein [Thermoanaerobaculia bacterium]
MSDGKVTVSLNSDEWRLLSALRAIPPSLLREKTLAAVEALVEYAKEPRCTEMQADGVPCDTVTALCEQCLHVTWLIDSLRDRTLEARRHLGVAV